MKKTAMKRWLVLVVGLAAIQGCKDDDPETGFRTASGQGSEDAGTQSVVIDLGHAVSEETTVSLLVGGDAALDGDYTAVSNSSSYNGSNSGTLNLTVKKGQSSATLTFDIIDDTQVEPGRGEVIYFQVASVAGSDATLDHATYMYEIFDNDHAPSSGLQTDLAWSIGEGVSINGVDFDLYLVHDVVVTGDEVSQSVFIDSIQSVHPSGFENFILSSTLPEDEYYLVFRYTRGTSDVELFLTLSQGASVRPLHGRFSNDAAGKDIYYGPIVKNSSRFNYRSSGADTGDSFSLEKARFFTGL